LRQSRFECGIGTCDYLSVPPPFDAARLIECERSSSALSPRALARRFAISPAGTFLTNTPVFQLKENLKLEPWMRALDVGCGAGAALRLLDERVRFEMAPVGLATALPRSARGVRGEGQPELLRALPTALPFGDGAFDFVMSGHLASHLEDDELQRFLLEVRRVLARGGLALVWDYSPTGNPRLDRWNQGVLARGTHRPLLRSTRALMAFGEMAGFGYIRPARLRPFLMPPIPRASVLLGLPPEGWVPS